MSLKPSFASPDVKNDHLKDKKIIRLFIFTLPSCLFPCFIKTPCLRVTKQLCLKPSSGTVIYPWEEDLSQPDPAEEEEEVTESLRSDVRSLKIHRTFAKTHPLPEQLQDCF